MPDIGDFIRRSRRSAKIAIAVPGTPGYCGDRRIKSPSVSLALRCDDFSFRTVFFFLQFSFYHSPFSLVSFHRYIEVSLFAIFACFIDIL